MLVIWMGDFMIMELPGGVEYVVIIYWLKNVIFYFSEFFD